MSKLVWDKSNERFFETGIDRGVLYIPNNNGAYVTGVAWSGLTAFNEAPTGAESNPQYADNIEYLNLISAERFAGTLEAFTCPREFYQFDGLASPVAGITVGQQTRKPFGLAYRTLIGNATEGQDFGYKIHVAYGLTAAPSEKNYATVNDSPEAMGLSWALTGTPVPVPGHKPSATLVIDSTQIPANILAQVEQMLYGDVGVDPVLPMPSVLIAMVESGATVVNPQVPAFNQGTNTITIPNQTGVVYTINGEVIEAGALVIEENTFVSAQPAEGYIFAQGIDADWYYTYED